MAVRDTAAECIKVCLALINEREQKSMREMLLNVHREIQCAFRENDPNFQHPALLVLSTLVALGNSDLLSVRISLDLFLRKKEQVS